MSKFISTNCYLDRFTPDNKFVKYKNLTDKIKNVCPDSHLNTFPKISYKQFFDEITETPDRTMQEWTEIVRENIPSAPK